MKFMTEAFVIAENNYDDTEEDRNEHLSEQIFEMCQMFSQQRPDLDEFAHEFSISDTVKQMGEQQLLDSVDHMMRKENGVAV